MQTELFKSAVVPIGEGIEVKYSVVSEEAAPDRALGCEMYGVQIEMGEETAVRPNLTASLLSVSALIDRMASGGVTPVSLNEVVDDWLAVRG
jgi:hypothetical protein